MNEHWDVYGLGRTGKTFRREKNKTKKPTKRTGSLAWCSKTLPENITGVNPFTSPEGSEKLMELTVETGKSG